MTVCQLNHSTFTTESVGSVTIWRESCREHARTLYSNDGSTHENQPTIYEKGQTRPNTTDSLWSLTHCFFGGWKTQPFWDHLTAFWDLAYLLPPDQWLGFACAWSDLVASFAVNCRLVTCYHRASLLHICYVGSLTHVSGGVYEYLDAFKGPGSNSK